ncbi:hypothetical protein GQ54DRAFT_312740 [Martensiomyces pterosporus]|nr:hypothetical protein GQ54DRAFT_312740 [Martensiomyces pterosporus]
MHDDPETPAGVSDYDSEADVDVDDYIQSMRVGRSKTQLRPQTTLQRRKTLMKEAKDPKADQEALEQEIRRVERLTSILGRRQTKFDRNRGPPKVNHDLDATLDGFFDLHNDDDDRVGDLLLLGSHQAASLRASEDIDDGIGIGDPVLRQDNIHATSDASGAKRELLYAQADDPFDQIDETHLAALPSGSAEYLPLDSLKSEDDDSAVAGEEAAVQSGVAVDTAGLQSNDGRAVGGKVAGNIDNILELESPTSDDCLVPGINRSSTWRLQSRALIAERSEYKPALLQNIDGDGGNEDQSLGTAADKGDAGVEGGSLSANAAKQPEQLPSAVDAATAAAVESERRESLHGDDVFEDYTDILDYYGDDSPGDGGHASSDLPSNCDSSASDSDSDSKYIAQIGQRRSFKIVNIADINRQPVKVEENEPRNNVSDPTSASSQTNAATVAPAITTAAGVEESVGQSAEHALHSARNLESGVQAGGEHTQTSAPTAGDDGDARSTLRRSHRLMSKDKSARGSMRSRGNRLSVASQDAASVVDSAEGSARSSIAEDTRLGKMVPASYWSTAKDEGAPAATQQQPQSAPPRCDSEQDPARRARSLAAVNKPLPYVPATKHNSLNTTRSAGASSSKPQSAEIPGLAQLAENAVMAAAALPTKMRSPKALPVLPNGATRKPPPIPDRVARTLAVAEARTLAKSVADASASTAATQSLGRASTSSSLGRPPPPLPTKERPKIPKEFMDDKLGSRAAIAAALEKPSAKSLFGSAMAPSELLAQPTHIASSASATDMYQAADARAPLNIYKASTVQPVAGTSGTLPTSLEDWLRRTDELLPTNNSVAKPDPIPPSNPGRPITFNSYRYQPAGKPAKGLLSGADASAQKSPEAASETSFYRPNSILPGKSTRSKGKVVRTVTALPPSQAFAQLATPNSPHNSSLSQPEGSLALSRTPTSSSSNSQRASIVSTTSATENRYSNALHIISAPAAITTHPGGLSTIAPLPASAAPEAETGTPAVASAPPHSDMYTVAERAQEHSMATSAATAAATGTATGAGGADSRSRYSSAYTPMAATATYGSAYTQPYPYASNTSAQGCTSAPPLAATTTLSAPPTTTAHFSSPYTGGLPAELVEPSAPMLVEPSAPQLPWNLEGPSSYTFPVPNFDSPPMQHGARAAATEPPPTSFAMPTPQALTSADLNYSVGGSHAGYPPSAHTAISTSASVGAQSPRLAMSPQPASQPSLPNKPRPKIVSSSGTSSRPTSTASVAPATALPPPPLATSAAPAAEVATPALSPAAAAVAAITSALGAHNLPDQSSTAAAASSDALSHPSRPGSQSVEDSDRARLGTIYSEYQAVPSKHHATKISPARDDSAKGPSNTSSRNSSLVGKKGKEIASAGNEKASPPAPLTVDTQASANCNNLEDASALTSRPSSSSTHQRSDSRTEIAEAEKQISKKEKEREIKRKAALFELVDTERTYTNDLRLVVELFLFPVQYLGNRKIVDVIFGDLVKVTEMNSKMYLDMVARLGPLAVFVDPEKANRKKKKRSNVVRSSNSSYTSGHPRSVLHGSSLRSPASPVAATNSVSISRRLSSAGTSERRYSSQRNSAQSYNETVEAMDNLSLNKQGSRHDDRASVVSNGDDQSVATSHSGGSSGEAGGHRYLTTTPGGAKSAGVGERHGSVRSMESMSEEDENDATKWTEDQVLGYFRNVGIGDIMSNYLKDFSEHYAQYSANHEKAVEYLKLVRESSSRLNLRNGATKEAHQKLLQTLERAEKDPRVRRLRLESFLLAPVQRVMRYPLLLEALLKYTPEDHPDHEDVALALSIAGSVATEVDRKSGELTNKRQLGELQTTFNWQQLLGGVQLNLDTYTKLVGQRRFVRKGPLRKASSGKHLYAILFNDFMMITVSERHGDRWSYEPYRLPIQAYDLLAREPNKDQFELVNLKSGEVLQLRADTSDDAVEWVGAIMRTADNCYKVVCEAISSGIQISNVKSVISPEARNKILQGRKPSAMGRRF